MTFAPKNVANALVAKTNSKCWNAGAEAPDDLVGQSAFAGRAGTGGDEDALGLQGLQLFKRDLVVSENPHFDLHLAQILDEVIGKRVVVVYDQQHDWPLV
jgi:hypothetical protein